MNCTNLTEINFFTDTFAVSSGCFSGCKSLSEIRFPSVATIDGTYDNKPFKGCTSLTKIYANTLMAIGNNTFGDDTHQVLPGLKIYCIKGSSAETVAKSYNVPIMYTDIDESLLTDYESTSNKVTTLDSNSTNEQYPSAKVTYDELVKKLNTNEAVGKKTKQGGEVFNDYENNVASNRSSHSEGIYTKASGLASHAEGNDTEASGDDSHAEGFESKAIGKNSHAEGDNTIASGLNSHTEGYATKASSKDQHVQGICNKEDTENKYAHIVGNGTSASNRSNAHTLDWDGNAWYQGTIKVGGTGYDDTAASTIATQSYVDTHIRKTVTGIYTGSGSSADRNIDLGFEPAAVRVIEQYGSPVNGPEQFSSWAYAYKDHPVNPASTKYKLVITSTGFTVGTRYNSNGTKYIFEADKNIDLMVIE